MKENKLKMSKLQSDLKKYQEELMKLQEKSVMKVIFLILSTSEKSKMK